MSVEAELNDELLDEQEEEIPSPVGSPHVKLANFAYQAVYDAPVGDQMKGRQKRDVDPVSL